MKEELSDPIHWQVMKVVQQFFEGDLHKTLLWMRLDNPMLGNVSPNTMIALGRGEKLLKFIEESIAENKK